MGWRCFGFRVLTFVLLTLLPLATSAAGAEAARAPRAGIDSLFGDETIAQGKGVKVTSSQLEQAFLSFKANLASRGERISDAERTFREAQLLDRLIITQLLTNRATAEDLIVAKTNAEKFLAESKKGSPNDESFNRQLRAMGLTPQQFERRVQDQAVAEAVIGRELKSKITTTDEDVQDFYKTGTDVLVKTMQADLDAMAASPTSKPAEIAALRERIDLVRKANLERLEQPEKVRIAHIFLSTRDREADVSLSAEQKKLKRQQIEKLRDRALGGEDFLKLVQDFSEDPGLKQTKGEYTLTRNDSFSPEFKSAAFSLAEGKISDVVATPFGLHVIKVLEKSPAQKTDFEKVSKELKEFLTQQSLQKAMPDYFARLKKDAAIEILEAKYRIEVKDTDPRAK
jgi:parvulin-like peptidyl-prolyl isomerase